MNLSEALTYLDAEIQFKKASLKNSLFILSMPIEDMSVGSIDDVIVKYYNNQSIACKVKRCNLTGEYEISIWW